MLPVPARLRPRAPVAADAILVGDPGRALLLAQELLVQPKMANHARGLWGYSGETPAGRELTIQSTGIGAPSAGAVLADLAELGVRRAIRVGTCVTIGPGLSLGSTVVVEAATGSDGVSRQLAPRTTPAPDPDLLAALAEAGTLGRIESGDLSPALCRAGLPPQRSRGTAAAGTLVRDLQSAALLALAPRLGIAAAVLLIIAESAAGERISDQELEGAAKRAGRAASNALSG